MNREEWINSPKTIAKSHKRYSHFDHRTDIQKVWDYISCPANIAQHSFYPFIHYTKDMSKYTKNHVLKLKERDICYAAHRDSCIFQYYCYLLDELYKERVRLEGISDVAVAYRTDLGLNNIALAKRAFDFIRSNDPCYIMIGDFTKFFDRLDHQYLKERWKDLLNVPTLPADHYAVFKNITRFSTWELDDLLTINNLPCDAEGKRQLNKQKTALTHEQFDENRSLIKKNPNSFGIPQGSPISALLANVYMLEIDRVINHFVKERNGFYMRYSDDFIIVLPLISEEDGRDAFSHIIGAFNDIPGIELQHEKTQFFSYDNNALSNCGSIFSAAADTSHRYINFLGFTFDGSKVSIRAKTISKYYYRMRRKAKTILRHREKNKHCSCENLYRLYSERGAHVNKRNTGNFLTYVGRAEKCFGSNEAVSRDTKRHMQKIRKAMTQSRKHE